MCDFISWVQTKNGEIVFLMDRDLKDKFIREGIDGSQGKDYIGHGAIRAAFPGIEGINHEERKIWQPELFPEKIRQYLANPQTVLATWGKMLLESFSTVELDFIGRNAPLAWRVPIFEFFVAHKSKDSNWAYTALSEVSGFSKKQRQTLFESIEKSPGSSYEALQDILDLTKKQEQELVESVAKDPEFAYKTLHGLRYRSDLAKRLIQMLVESVATAPWLVDKTLWHVSILTKKQRQLLESVAG